MAAGKLFMKHGFAAVTMESIAAEATSSKVTLYNYFSSKEVLLEAYILEVGKGMVERLLDSSAKGQTREEVLHHLGKSYLELVTKPEIVALNRLTIGEAGRFPALSHLFYELGPKRTLSSIDEVMNQLMEKGWLRQAEIRKVSLHFKALCEAEMVERILWGLELVEADALEAAALSGVEAFIQLYGKE
ncbi:TetR/AcrR family transcriptional regulator [Pectobacterium brasiliense]|nr:TetR/AcrR family transcriptional regulator [Pectobacterium brasiliense]